MRTILDVSVEDIEKRRFPDKHYEYVVRVHWSDGTVNVIYRRYSRFFSLQSKVLDKFPKEAGIYDPADRIIPFLPGKIFFGRSQIRKVALDRMQKINDYCKALVRLPTKISECKEILHFFEPQEEDLKPTSDNIVRNKVDDVAGDSISDPVLLEQYVAIADYRKDGRNETSLRAGSVIEVVEKNETGWWFVNTDVGQGWVPSSYLEKPSGDDNRIMPSHSIKGNKYICTHDYEAKDSDEISMKKGGFVQVLEKNLDGWWLVRYQNREGRAPSTFLLSIDTLKAKRLLKKSHKGAVEVVPTAKHASNMSDVRRLAKNNAQSNARNGGQPGAHRGPISGDATSRLNRNSQNEVVSNSKTRLFKNQLEQQLEQQKYGHDRMLHDQMSDEKCEYLELEQDTYHVFPNGDDDYEIMEDWGISADPSYIDPELAQAHVKQSLANQIHSNESLNSIGSTSSDGDSPLCTKAPPRRKTLERSVTSIDQVMNQDENDPEDIYIVIESYKNTAGDGIDLVEGETVTVLEQTEVGWWLVVGLQGEGWAPAAFIQKATPPTVNKPKQEPLRPPPPKLPNKTANSRPVLNQMSETGMPEHTYNNTKSEQFKPKPVPRPRGQSPLKSKIAAFNQDNLSYSGSQDNCRASSALPNKQVVSRVTTNQGYPNCDVTSGVNKVHEVTSGVAKIPVLPVGRDNRLKESGQNAFAPKGLASKESNINSVQNLNSNNVLTENQNKPVVPNTKPGIPNSKPVISKNKPILTPGVKASGWKSKDENGKLDPVLGQDQGQNASGDTSRVNKLKHMFEHV